jgi:hypothetical protein
MNENPVELCRRHHADWAHALADCANNFGSRATAATLDLIERNYGSLKWQGKMDTFAVMRQILNRTSMFVIFLVAYALRFVFLPPLQTCE